MLRRSSRLLSVFLIVALASTVAMLVLGTCRPSTVEIYQPLTPEGLAEATATPIAPTIQPTVAPTATAEPTASPVPEPTATLLTAQQVFDQHFERSGLTGKLTAPIDCDVVVDPGAAPDYLATIFRCGNSPARVPVVAGGPGRVVMVVRSHEGQLTEAPATYEEWSWDRGLSLGNYLILDHGPVPPWSSAMTLHAGLSAINPDLVLGQTVEEGTVIGWLDDGAPLQYEIWPQGQPLTVVPSEPREREATPSELAGKMAISSVPPIDPVCRFPASEPSSLPNAGRPYRNGTHRGVDFVCSRRGLDAKAFADGEVVMVVRDYADAQPADRDALLQSGVDMGDTPHWTLMMLYGNFVVIEHVEDSDLGRWFTIYAHLEEVDPGVVLGEPIAMGARVGEVGNRGTSNSAANTTDQNLRSLHLHWELHVDGQYLGAGLGAEESEAVYRLLLCDDPTLLEGC